MLRPLLHAFFARHFNNSPYRHSASRESRGRFTRRPRPRPSSYTKRNGYALQTHSLEFLKLRPDNVGSFVEISSPASASAAASTRRGQSASRSALASAANTATPTPQTPATVHATRTMATKTTVPSLQIQLLSESAKAPTRGSKFAAGLDLYAAEETVIPARGRGFVATGIAIAVPVGTYGRVAPRSGLAAKHGIDTGAGVIDADYRGEVKVILFNFSDEEFAVNVGDRVAQLIVERIVTPEVEVVQMLDQTVRGAGGFGSTGGFGVQV
ncbi:dUTP diphosphatase [Trichodelitschia bisporula]|uniref:Deoxyuridine 5'-triphosphate nucleotidohydrolase n=1 Tax=Trichodelitschia bisporula TaxID=703511 RepID=A0A6G1I6U0_9PEZI|nr:dUTP diphosphatase [Trichodelitschia bisporula]